VSRLAALALCLCACAARADATFEERLVSRALSWLQREPEPAPDGLSVDEVLVFSEDIVGPEDPYPSLVNWPHARTKRAVVDEELLLRVGEPWDPARAEESARVLRSLGILSVARVVPVRSPAPGKVSVLVVTKDLWSIRFNQVFTLVGPLLTYYRNQPHERNFLGRNAVVGLEFIYKRDTLSVGERVEQRRFLGSRVTAAQSAAAVFNHGTGALEGGRAWLYLGQPLYTLAPQWGWSASGHYGTQRTRVFQGAEVWQLPLPAEVPGGTVPFVFDASTGGGEVNLVRRDGTRFVRDLQVAVGGYHRRYTAPASLPSAQATWLSRTQLPRSEDAVYLSGSFRLFEPRYAVFENLDSLGLSEDVQLGPSLLAQARWATPLLFSPTRYVEAGLRVRQRWALSGNLLTASAAAGARYTPGGDAQYGRALVDKRAAVQLSAASRMLGPVRVVGRAYGLWREQPLSAPLLQLGGDSGLRGLPAEVLSGRNQWLGNLEVRTAPWNLHTLHVGLVLFYDVGTAWNDTPASAPVHAVGAGLRLRFPQFDTQVLRLDVGWALNGPPTALQDRFSASFGQVTDLAPGMLDAPL